MFRYQISYNSASAGFSQPLNIADETTTWGCCVGWNQFNQYSPALGAAGLGSALGVLTKGDQLTPNTWTYNFTISQRTPWRSVAEFQYSGNKSYDLMQRGPLSNINNVPLGAFFKPDPKTGVVNDPSSGSFPANDYRPFANYTDITLVGHGSYSNYNAFIATWQKQSGRTTFTANYTFSKAFDDVTDYNSDFQANDQTNLAAERALSPFDQRHKLVIAGVFTPFKKDRAGSLARKLFAGFTFSPALRGNSSRPFNLLAGADVNGDRHSTSDRPPGAGRNTGRGPNFWTFDVRVMRQFSLTEKARLQLTAEGFNLMNHTNFATVNNVVGPNFAPPFDVKGMKDRSPNQPLGFTAANPMRQIQLGVRLVF